MVEFQAPAYFQGDVWSNYKCSPGTSNRRTCAYNLIAKQRNSQPNRCHSVWTLLAVDLLPTRCLHDKLSWKIHIYDTNAGLNGADGILQFLLTGTDSFRLVRPKPSANGNPGRYDILARGNFLSICIKIWLRELRAIYSKYSSICITRWRHKWKHEQRRKNRAS